MRAIITPAYGAPDVLELRELPAPTAGAGQVLIEVHATAVTEGDRRLRSADFPRFTRLLGRLMVGLRKPRAPLQGSMFAGRVVQVGAGVSRFAVGDDVFGSVETGGANAELLAMKADGPVARMPAGLSYAEAAAAPYGALTALHFLRDQAQLQRGERVLVLGASGGVGRFAVQLARHMGADVTAVCGADHHDLVGDLGAHHVIDYRTTDWTTLGERWDVVFDIADASSFGHARRAMTLTGRYLTLYLSPRVLLQMAWTSVFRRGQKARFTVSLGNRADMEHLAGLLADGVVTPVVGDRLPLARIADAHRAIEAGRRAGCVVVDVVGGADRTSSALRQVPAS